MKTKAQSAKRSAQKAFVPFTRRDLKVIADDQAEFIEGNTSGRGCPPKEMAFEVLDWYRSTGRKQHVGRCRKDGEDPILYLLDPAARVLGRIASVLARAGKRG